MVNQESDENSWPKQPSGADRRFQPCRKGSLFVLQKGIYPENPAAAGNPKCGQTAALWQRLHVLRRELREGVRRGFLEPRESAAEHEFHHVSWAVALLGDSKLRLLSLFGRRARFEEMRPVDEHHHVGVLFDRPRLAQIRKLRPAFVALRRARELAEHQH